MPKQTPTNRKERPPHMIMERQLARGYRKTGKVNLSECEGGGSDLVEYEKWLKEIPLEKKI